MASDNEKRKLTEKIIETASCTSEDGKPIILYDTQIKGLAVRVTRSGVKSFFVRRWVKNRAQRVQLGRYSATAGFIDKLDGRNATLETRLSLLKDNPLLSLSQARRLAEAVLGNLDVAQEKRSTGLTLGEAFEEYMTRHMEKSRKTAGPTRKDFERDLKMWSKRELSDITASDVEKLHGKLGHERGIYTANRRIQLLRAIYNFVKKRKRYHGDNPAAGVTLFTEQARERFLTPDESSRLWEALDNETGDVRDYLKLLMLCGQRKSTTLAMRWDEIDLEGGLWHTPETKNGNRIAVSLTETELGILRDRYKSRKDSPWVFPSDRSESGHLVEPRRLWDRIRQTTGITDVTLHDQRRSLGTHMANTGADSGTTMRTLGQKDIKTTLKHYSFAQQETQRAAKEKAHARFVPAEESEKVTRLKRKSGA